MSDDSNLVQSATLAPTVLLTDTSKVATASRLAIALSKAGLQVDAVCPTRIHLLSKTRAVRKTYSYSWIDPLASLEEAIAAAQPSIVIPCDDRGVQDLHELYCYARASGPSKKSLADLIERSLGPAENYPIVLSRHDLLRIASQENLLLPETKLVGSLADLDAWAKAHAFPWVLKADGTCGGRGVRIVHTHEEAEHAYQEITRPPRMSRVVKRLIVDRDAGWLRPWWKGASPAVIVQSYVTGRPANCAVACWKGRVLAGIGVEVVSTQNATGPATVVRVVENPNMSLATEKIASRLGLSGFFGLDFMIEERSGATHLIEMNPRCTPLCHLQLGRGRDMVSALVAQLTGQRLHEAPPVTKNDLIAYFPRAWTFNSDLLHSCFQDVPSDEPELVEELLHPTQNRQFIFQRLAKRRAARAIRAVSKSPQGSS